MENNYIEPVPIRGIPIPRVPIRGRNGGRKGVLREGIPSILSLSLCIHALSSFVRCQGPWWGRCSGGREEGETKEERRMKRKRMTLKIGALGAMALMLLVAFAGTTTVGCPPVITETWCEYDLIAGQDEDAGTVEIYYKSQGENTWLEIYIITEDGWKIDESHVDIQYLPENFPATKKGNFKIGKFEYSTPTSATSTQHYYNIADGWVVDGCGSLVIAVHAVVYKGCGEEAQWETAWGNGEPFGGNWQMYINFPCCKYPDYPTGIDLKMWWTHWGAESYWDVTILEDGSYDLDDYDNIDYDT
ncbi:MAG: hypothetical protein KAQ96_06895, partial [Thermoplasmata archaeon]|nr:hypothetical protein [Thermoplasmata archaeon]